MSSSADLERALLRELLKAWQQVNRTDFGGALRPPLLALHDDGTLGQYQAVRRVLSLQRDLCWNARWGQVLEVLRHEVAHQYVREVLDVQESAHGPTFRRVCRERGIDARAAGLPGDVDPETDRLVRKVRGLMALSRSSNPHEARAAAAAARRLVARHDLDLGEDAGITFTFRQVGPTKARFDPWEKVLGGLLAEHFGVSTIYAWAYRPDKGTWGRVLELLGPSHHVEVAAYVHDVLTDAGQALWKAHKRDAGLTGDSERRRFLYGVVTGYRSALVATPEEPQDTALVHVDAARIQAYVGQRYPSLRSSRTSQVRVSEATKAGRAAGRKLSIRTGVEGKEGGGPKLLEG